MTGVMRSAPVADGSATAAVERSRRRARGLLSLSAALGATSLVVAGTVAVIAAREMLGPSALAGTAPAAVTVGIATGTSVLAAVIARWGQRRGLSTGYVIGAIGALVAAWAFVNDQFWLLLLGLFQIGFASSAAALSRYASAEMAIPERRGAAISLVVWANTVGAVAGPALVPLAAGAALALGLAELLGPLLATSALAAAAGLLLTWLLRPDVRALAVTDAGTEDAHVTDGPRVSMRAVLRRPTVAFALVAMIMGQVVMIVIMSMTPVHMTDRGHDLAAVGVVISGHMLGMFALSPVSGWISDRVGDLAAIMASIVVLAVAASLSALAPADGGGLLFVALFVLGYGWNLGFVAGSSMLTSSLGQHERTRAQGFADTLVWSSSALASLGAGVLLTISGYAALGVAGLVSLAIAGAALVRLRGAVAPVGAAE